MDIEEYLTRKKAHLAKNAERIRDFHVFDFNYIPKKPLLRQEAQPLIDALLRYQETGKRPIQRRAL